MNAKEKIKQIKVYKGVLHKRINKIMNQYGVNDELQSLGNEITTCNSDIDLLENGIDRGIDYNSDNLYK